MVVVAVFLALRPVAAEVDQRYRVTARANKLEARRHEHHLLGRQCEHRVRVMVNAVPVPVVHDARQRHYPRQCAILRARCLQHHHVRSALVVVLVTSLRVTAREHPVTVQHYRVPCLRSVVRRALAVRLRQHHPAKLLAVIQVHGHLARLRHPVSIHVGFRPRLRYRLVLRGHVSHQSPVIGIAHALMRSSLNVKRLTLRLVILPPSVLRRRGAVVVQRVALPSLTVSVALRAHHPRFARVASRRACRSGRLLHRHGPHNLRARAAQIHVASHGVELPYLQRVEHRLAPHHQVCHAQRVFPLRVLRYPEAPLQCLVKRQRA